MGTRGYFAFRYKNRYYIIYNNYDSYFEGLGYSLIRSIQELTNEQWEHVKTTLGSYDYCASSEKEDSFNGDLHKDNVILTVIDTYTGSTITRHEPKLDLFIEYVYILDLDINIFTAVSRHHKDEDSEFVAYRYNCRFENLSKEWLDSCESW